jgi:outer membrane immunogenic protein
MTLKLIKSGVAAMALLATPFAADAADIRTPVYKGVPRSVISYYNWSGFYAGLNVGYGTGTSEWAPLTLDISPKGMTYGATFGYNWQAGSWVYGVEADYNLSNMKGSASCVVVFTCETSNTWFATFRGRVGYAFDRFMPYVTAGGAYGNIKASINTVPAMEASESNFGYAFGAGLEYALFGSWTTKVEYLYINLGSFDPSFTVPVANSVSFDASIIRVGLNYKF